MIPLPEITSSLKTLAVDATLYLLPHDAPKALEIYRQTKTCYWYQGKAFDTPESVLMAVRASNPRGFMLKSIWRPA